MSETNQLDINERRNNPEPVTIFVGGAIGLAALLAWLMGRDAKPRKRATAGPGPGPGPTPEPEPEPEPPPGPGPQPPPGPGGLQPGDQGLYISGDCKRVIEGKDWMEVYALPKIIDFVRSGRGLPIYTEAQVDQSLDWVIRQIVHPWSPNCVDQSPWLDRYVRENPVPKPNPGETTNEYQVRLKEWDDEWDREISLWANAHSQLYNLYKRIGTTVFQVYNNEITIDPYRQPVDRGTAPRGLTQADKDNLMSLGYDIWDEVVGDFQNDYNLVRDYMTNWEWTTSGMDITVDNKIGPKTRQAIQLAIEMQAGRGPWQMLVYTARENI